MQVKVIHKDLKPENSEWATFRLVLTFKFYWISIPPVKFQILAWQASNVLDKKSMT
jgi:hypothetical protein